MEIIKHEKLKTNTNDDDCTDFVVKVNLLIDQAAKQYILQCFPLQIVTLDSVIRLLELGMKQRQTGQHGMRLMGNKFKWF